MYMYIRKIRDNYIDYLLLSSLRHLTSIHTKTIQIYIHIYLCSYIYVLIAQLEPSTAKLNLHFIYLILFLMLVLFEFLTLLAQLSYATPFFLSLFHIPFYFYFFFFFSFTYFLLDFFFSNWRCSISRNGIIPERTIDILENIFIQNEDYFLLSTSALERKFFKQYIEWNNSRINTKKLFRYFFF